MVLLKIKTVKEFAIMCQFKRDSAYGYTELALQSHLLMNNLVYTAGLRSQINNLQLNLFCNRAKFLATSVYVSSNSLINSYKETLMGIGYSTRF